MLLVVFIGNATFSQSPTVVIPNANIGTGSILKFASDGTTAYYLLRSNGSPAVISLYKIDGGATTPTFVKDILREDTARITEQSTTTYQGVETGYECKIDYFDVINGKMLLTYVAIPSQTSFNITGYRLMVSDGTSAGTTNALVVNFATPKLFNGNLGGLQLYKTNNNVYFTYIEAVGTSGIGFSGTIYKTDGTISGTSAVFTTPSNESLLAQNFKFYAKNGNVYFSTYTYSGSSITNWKYYRSNGNTPELITTETAFSNFNYFNVSNTHILIAYAFQASVVGLPSTTASIGFKKISLSTGFAIDGTYAINPYTPNTGNGAKDGYDFPIAEFNGTFYIAGFKDYKKCLYKIDNSHAITSWDFPLNAGFTFNIPQGNLSFKRAANKLYMNHFYSAHPYTTVSAFSPANARTSSLYYLDGSNPILVDSTTALQGVINPSTAATIGDVVVNNSTYLVTGSTFVSQDKLWKTDGTKANTGIVPNLFNCTPSSFSVQDISPKNFITHNNRIYFFGNTGCSFSDALPALYSWNVGGTLPLTWISFDGKLVDKKVQLQWQTTNEVDNIGFDIERSEDGRSFTKIAFVAALNKLNNSYNFTDASTEKSVYYCLKQQDKDGEFTYSKIIKIATASKGFNVEVYPTIINSQATVSITADEKSKATLSISNLQGRLLKTNYLNLVAGSQTQTIDCSSLAEGVYLVSVIVNNSKEVFKIIKK
ncbi:MAG: T9SS type A sorting domain-containing protein [Chitinophagaceae bacterium]